MSTDSGTYIPNGKGIGYLPQVFIDPKYAATVTQTDTENDSETDPPQIPFLGNIAGCASQNGPGASVS